MTFEEYLVKIRLINTRLDQISNRTAQMALVQSAHTDNPTFVDLMTAFDALINQSEDLTTKMMGQLKTA
jgi:predicted  nucleic acid-binding Zn-ribbon protein